MRLCVSGGVRCSWSSQSYCIILLPFLAPQHPELCLICSWICTCTYICVCIGDNIAHGLIYSLIQWAHADSNLGGGGCLRECSEKGIHLQYAWKGRIHQVQRTGAGRKSPCPLNPGMHTCYQSKNPSSALGVDSAGARVYPPHLFVGYRGLPSTPQAHSFTSSSSSLCWKVRDLWFDRLTFWIRRLLYVTIGCIRPIN